MAGKRALTVIAKARQNEAIKRKTEMERIRLKKAMDSMEVAVLDKAIEKATQRIGRGHLYVVLLDNWTHLTLILTPCTLK